MLPSIAEIAQKAYTAALESVNIINTLNLPKELNSEDIDTVQRNKLHLKLILESDFWTTEDLNPLKNAILTAEEIIIKNSSIMVASQNNLQTHISPPNSDPLHNPITTANLLNTAPSPVLGASFTGVAPVPIPAPVPAPGVPTTDPQFIGPVPVPAPGAPTTDPQFIGPAPVPAPGAPTTDPQFIGPAPVPAPRAPTTDPQFIGPAPVPAPGAPFSGTVPSPELTDFQALNYIASNNDLIPSIGTDIEAAKSHYRDIGFREGRNIDSFNASDYLEKYTDLKNVFGSDQDKALKHYIQNGFREGRNDQLADPQFRDPPQIVGDVFMGFSSSVAPVSGAPFTGTVPSLSPEQPFSLEAALSSDQISDLGAGVLSDLSDFQALNYIASHDDLITNFGTDIEAAKSHYKNYGKAEGRTLDNFDEWGYLASNNDLLTTFGGDPLEAVKNYISFGKLEDRSTNSFDAQSYLNNNLDLRNAFGADKELATKHYVEYGFNEGRSF